MKRTSGSFAGITALFVIFLTATVFQQSSNPRYTRIRALDVFGVLPMWSFFAPVPAQHDFYILWRLVNADGTYGEWQELLQSENRKWYYSLFFPGRRHSKIIFDLVQDLQRSLSSGHEETVASDPAYVALKTFARRQAREASENAPHFQICALRDTGFDEAELPEVLLLSKMYSTGLGT